MSIYWSNIDNSYTTSADGTTSADAFDYFQLSSFLKGNTVEGSIISADDTIKIRGDRSNSTVEVFDTISVSGLTLSGWGGVDDSWHWKVWETGGDGEVLISTDTPAHMITIIDGLINKPNLYAGKFYIRNCWFSDVVGITPDELADIYGCTFGSNVDVVIGSYADNDEVVTFDRCVFDCGFDDEGTSAGTINVFNSIFSKSLADVSAAVLSSTFVTSGCTFSYDFSASFPNVSAITSANIIYQDYEIPFATYAIRKAYTSTKDFYGHEKRGPGAFNFDNTFYVDLSASTSGYGTSANPFGGQYFFDTWLNYDFYEHLDDYKIKANYSLSGSFNSTGGYACPATYAILNFGSWDLSTYGPWRVHSDADITFGGDSDPVFLYNANDFIFDAPTVYFGIGSESDTFGHYPVFKNAVLFAPTEISYTLTTSSSFYGCDLVSDHLEFGGYGTAVAQRLYLKDCVIDLNEISAVDAGAEHPTVYIEDSVTTAPSTSGLSGSFIGELTYSNVQDNWTAPTWPDWDAEKNSWKFTTLGNGISVSSTSAWSEYPTGLWGYTRYDIGAFYFNIPIVGHIGAFYFGPGNRTIDVDTLIVSAGFIAPVATASVSSSYLVPAPLEVITKILSPIINTDKLYDILVSFVGVPRCGSSPLIVDFIANVTFGGNYQDKYYVTEYKWYFDYENSPTTYETSTSATISHTYTGYAGQKYDVRLEVIVGVK